MKKSEAKTIIKEFVNKNKGKNVLFNTLNDTDKKAYVLTKSFMYFNKFLKTSEALTRALNNAEAHGKNDFEFYKNNINECMIIAE